MRCIGLMSGTSLDGLDGVLAAFDDAGRPTLLASASRPMPQALRAELAALQTPGHDELARAALAAQGLTDLATEVVAQLLHAAGLGPADVDAIGSHGQTVRHRPDLGYTLQIDAPARLAERTGIPVAADFRSRDVAAGGQGAPLVPAFHAALLACPGERRVVLNLGGIANLSVLPGDGRSPVTGWDTGPANVLMDAWIEHHRGLRFDADGAWAASGCAHAPLLASLLAEPWLRQPPPKSTGRDLFHLPWLLAHLQRQTVAPTAQDVQATLLEFTARTAAQACRDASPHRVLVCGGGARNRALMARLQALLPDSPVQPTDDVGVPAGQVEALAFAWLARARLLDLPGNLREVTGAAGPRVLGALHAR